MITVVGNSVEEDAQANLNKRRNLNTDNLNQNISFLQQKVCFFKDVGAKLIVPIVLNCQHVTYKYGDLLIKEGQVPPGLMVIVHGQCKSYLTRVAEKEVEDLKFETRPPWSISKKKVNVNAFQQIKLD